MNWGDTPEMIADMVADRDREMRRDHHACAGSAVECGPCGRKVCKHLAVVVISAKGRAMTHLTRCPLCWQKEQAA